MQMSNLQSCSVLWGGNVYGFDERLLKCIDFNDGEEQWRERGMGKGSLSMCVDGRMLIMSDTSEFVIAQAAPGAMKTIARSRVLPRSMCRTVPVLANNRIFMRNANGDMACLDVK